MKIQWRMIYLEFQSCGQTVVSIGISGQGIVFLIICQIGMLLSLFLINWLVSIQSCFSTLLLLFLANTLYIRQ